MKTFFQISQRLYYNPFEHKLLYSAEPYKDMRQEVPVDSTASHKKPKKDRYLFPTSAGIFLTNACPLRCVYCSDDSGINAATLSKNQIQNYLRLIVKKAIIRRYALKSESCDCILDITGGGEPTSRLEILKYCIETFKRLCQDAGAAPHIAITTNGACSRETVDFLIANTDLITISYDGMSAIQNRNRRCKSGAPSDEIVSGTIRHVNDSGHPYVIRTTIGKDDYIRLNEMFDHIRQNYGHVLTWHIEPIYRIGRGTRCEMAYTSFAECYLDLLEYSKDKKHDFQIANTAFSEDINLPMCDSLRGKSIWLNAYGQLYGCAAQNDFEKSGLGYVSDKGIQLFDAKEDDALLDYHEATLKRCSECYAYAHCGGGCPMNMPRDSEGELASDDAKAVCEGIRHYWQQFIVRLYDSKEYAGYRLVVSDRETIPNGIVYDIVKERN